jgi:hypothetical protein
MNRIAAGLLGMLVAVGSGAANGAESAEAIAEQSKALEAMFLRHYAPVEFSVEPNAPQLELPLGPAAVGNRKQLERELPSEAARAMLARNGFVVVDGPGTDLFSDAYSRLKRVKIPIVVTSDSVLHLHHVLFDNALKEIEEEKLWDDLKALCAAMIEKAAARLRLTGRDELPVEADRATLAYFSVAMRLLDPDWTLPEDVAPVVKAELALIGAHGGVSPSPLFGYKEDYSQYVPRGHYTRSIKLRRYFKAMMWLGRMTFLLKGNNDEISDALVDEAMANRQTLQALMIAKDISEDADLYAKWRRIYVVTAFFVGLADDLTVDDYAETGDELSKQMYASLVWGSPAWFRQIRLELAKKRSPLIYGGTGAAVVAKYTDAEVLKTLEATKGMRVMGQRFVPDSYVMGRLVNLPYTGHDQPFTMVVSALGPVRGFPRGLDVMHLLGSARALTILQAEGDTDYEGYAKHVGELQEVFAGFDRDAWHQNLYWGWLSALRTLLAPCGDGYPSFMQTEAYTDKALNTALASWSQLRHDTILYAKQSYAMAGAGPPPPPTAEPEGLVEPVPALYAELVAVNTMALQGLKELGVISEPMEWRFERTDRILRRLLELSVKELQGEALSQPDLEFIKEFGETLDDAIGELTDDSKRTTIVADVHTEPNSGLVLEEGTGRVDMMWAVWKTPAGDVVAGAGPVLSHYEFKQPMRDRLADEKWREMVKEKAPARSPWTRGFRIDEE